MGKKLTEWEDHLQLMDDIERLLLYGEIIEFLEDSQDDRIIVNRNDIIVRMKLINKYYSDDQINTVLDELVRDEVISVDNNGNYWIVISGS